MKPRIYTYKITFEETPFYYYGSKKEKVFNEPYMGSPKTNKWHWKTYTPKKQILEFFDYDEQGYKKCREIENRLIKHSIEDPFCLNAGYSGYYKPTPCSLETKKKISIALMGKCLSQETRDKLSALRMGSKNVMFGKNHSENTKKKIAEKARGRKHSYQTKEKISRAFRVENHPLYGIGHTDETKKKMSESTKGRYVGRKNPNCKIRNWRHDIYGLHENLAIFELVEKFNFLSLNGSKLSGVATGKLKSHKGWSMV